MVHHHGASHHVDSLLDDDHDDDDARHDRPDDHGACRASLEQMFDPANDAHIAEFVAFAEAHLQQVVRLNVSWDAFSTDPPSVDAQPEWEPGSGLLYARDDCLDDPFCGGMEVFVRDLGSTPDANLCCDSGSWVLSGRFAVQAVTIGTGGVMSVSLRAVPIQ